MSDFVQALEAFVEAKSSLMILRSKSSASFPTDLRRRQCSCLGGCPQCDSYAAWRAHEDSAVKTFEEARANLEAQVAALQPEPEPPLRSRFVPHPQDVVAKPPIMLPPPRPTGFQGGGS